MAGLLFAALVLNACGSGAAPRVSPSPAGGSAKAAAASSSPVKPLGSLNAAYVSISSHTLPIWIASEKGFFKNQGLDVHVSYVQGSVTAMPALASGDLGIIEATPAASVQAQLAGQDTVALATHVPYADYRLMAAKSISRVNDLRGKTIGATKAGTVDDVVIQYVLRKQGLEPGKDITMTYLNTQPAQLAALQQGLIQAAPLSPPNDLTAEKAGAHDILNVLDLHYPYPVDGIVSTRKFVREHPDQTVAFLKGYLQGIRFIRSDPAETKRIMSNNTKETDPQVLDAGYQDLIADLDDNPLPKTDGIATVLPLFKGGEGKNPANFVDAAPMTKAISELK